MRIATAQITETAKNVAFAERIDDLDGVDRNGKVNDFRFPSLFDVALSYYRSGQQLFFRGSFRGNVEGRCSRCLKSYSFPVVKEYDFILTPEPLVSKNGRVTREELGLSFYAGDEVDLSPFIREQLLLALPIRPLCDEACRGLCAACGANLNLERCSCEVTTGDPRMAVFRSLKVGR